MHYFQPMRLPQWTLEIREVPSVSDDTGYFETERMLHKV